MKVLVTGNQGYIGTVLTRTLREKGFDVVGMDIGLFKDCVFGELDDECETLRVDVRHAKPEHFEGIDAVVHLAAISNDPLGNINSSITLDVNYHGAMNVARAAKQAGVKRFIFASSCSLYGLAGDDILDETADFNPVTPYGESKVHAEAGLKELADENFCPVYMRNGTLFGYSPRLRGDLAINNLTGYAHAIGKILLNSDGKAWRPFVHIDDVCESIVAALQADRDVVFNQAFNVANDDLNVQVMDVVHRIKNIVPECETAFGEGTGADTRNYKVSGNKIATRLKFTPTRTIDDGINQVYDAYKKYDLTLEKLEGPMLVRLQQLKKLLDADLLDENFSPKDLQQEEMVS